MIGIILSGGLFLLMGIAVNHLDKRVLNQCIEEHIYEGRSYFNQNISASDCYFTRIALYEGKGGVIFLDGSFSIMITSSMICFCSCSDRGGAVFLMEMTSFLKRCVYTILPHSLLIISHIYSLLEILV